MRPRSPLTIRFAIAAIAALFCSGKIDNASAAPSEHYTVSGGSANEQFGAGLACMAALRNGGAVSDVLVGAPGESGTFGKISVLDGANGSNVLLTSSGSSSISSAGSSVAFVGDADADGDNDLVYGEPGSGTAVLIKSNGGGGIETSIQFGSSQAPGPSEKFGFAMDPLGQSINTCGGGQCNAVIISAPLFGSVSQFGSVEIFDLQGTSPAAVRQYSGSTTNERLGSAVASTGDLDKPADGFRDVIAGGPGSGSGAGLVRIFSSSSAGVQLSLILGINSGDSFGHAVASIGDVDGNGREDILVGAPGVDGTGADSGGVYLFLGEAIVGAGASGVIPNCSLSGASAGDQFGFAVAGLNDISGNGSRYFAVGAPGTNSDTGRVYVYSFSGGTCVERFQLDGQATGERFGVRIAGRIAVGGLCDINGDAISDFMISSEADSPGTDAGAVTVFKGIPFPIPTATPTATPTSTPTATPTSPGVAPSSARLSYKFSPEGDLVVTHAFDVAPLAGEPCGVTLYGRTSDTNLEKIGEVTTIDSLKTTAERTVRFRASGLPKAQQAGPNNAYVLHLMTRSNCAGRRFNSNVMARFLTCGVIPALPIEPWMRNLTAQIRADDDPGDSPPAGAKNKKKKKKKKKGNIRPSR